VPATRLAAIDLNALPPTAAGSLDPNGFLLVRVLPGDLFDIFRERGQLPPIGHHLFDHLGVPDNSVRVPASAFGHTDPAAIVYLSARLADGTPLPAWLRLDPVSGTFIGVPPEGFDATLEIEVVARDTEGREARVQFSLDVDALRDAAVVVAARDSQLGLDVDSAETKRAKLEAARQAERAEREGKGKADKAARGTPTFSEQMKGAKGKADPLLDRIMAKGEDKPRPPR
jgi:hypothetical protein